GARTLPRPGRDLERTGGAAQSVSARCAAAGAGGERVVDLDGLLHAAVALQLDAAILPAGRRPGAELDRHRPADLQPELYGCRFRGGRRPFRGGGPPHAPTWLVVV